MIQTAKAIYMMISGASFDRARVGSTTMPKLVQPDDRKRCYGLALVSQQ
jgi:hypothetical protein